MSTLASQLLFDTKLRHKRQIRALKHKMAADASDESIEFLLNEAADCLLDRFFDIKSTFSLAVDIGAHTGQIAEKICNFEQVKTLISTETNIKLADQCPEQRLVINEDCLPLSDKSVDLVLSCLSLHWVNDLPKILKECHRILKPGGLFLATMPGEETLHELRESFARAELECDGGISPRVVPMVTIKDSGRLLQAAGFENPIADRDRITVDYSSPLKLMHDLRNMGETNPMYSRIRKPLRRQTLMQMMKIYHDLHTNDNERYLATFDLITMTAWKPES